MSKFDELERKIKHYRWLQNIAQEYTSMIELLKKEKEYFRLSAIEYSARGDTRKFNLNLHRTIPCKYIRDGLQDALNGINNELLNIEEELKEWI